MNVSSTFHPAAVAAEAPSPVRGDGLRVVYIMGYGHSGSTILDALLAEADGVEGIGELASLSLPGWHEKETELCACGAAIKDCAFWGAVGRTWLAATGERDFSPLIALRGHLRRWKARRAGQRWDPRSDSAFGGFASLVRALYESIAEVSGSRIIVDSSKSVGRARFLSRIPGLDLRVIHLVRDSRAVAWSLAKKETSVWRTAMAWRHHNLLADEVRTALPTGRACLVRYEDLVFRTPVTLRRIGDCAGIDLGEVAGRIGRAEPIRFRHEVGGNHVRRTGPARLKADVAWIRDMPRRWQGGVWLLTHRALHSYGYDRRPLVCCR